MVYGTHKTYAKNNGAQAAYKTFRDLDLVVESSRRTLSEVEFDAIAVTGVSGLSVGSPLALALKKKLLVLRKQCEDTHGDPGELLGREDLNEGTRVLVVDDFYLSGATGRAIYGAVLRFNPDVKIVGGYAYESDEVYEGDAFCTKIGWPSCST